MATPQPDAGQPRPSRRLRQPEPRSCLRLPSPTPFPTRPSPTDHPRTWSWPGSVDIRSLGAPACRCGGSKLDHAA